jgi:glycosyltransferase involved in cell wall biosynthesis
MNSKPELIVISQNLMGGGASFHRNMIDNKPDNFFEIRCIYSDPLHWAAKRLENVSLGDNDIIFSFKLEPKFEIAKRLNQHISNREGVIVANLYEELLTLSYFPKPNKTVFFICHDKGFLYLIKKFDYIIDVFIAHNIEVYESIQVMLPKRKKNIYFIQHGVQLQQVLPRVIKQNLNLVFLARHVKLKGIYDLPKIDQLLKKQNIIVNWMILGDGEERENFMKEVKGLNNFQFLIPETTEDVITILKNQDVYILPSSHDGLPVSLLESMSVGCVPIVYNFSEGIKRVITKDIGFVTDIGDAQAVADKIFLLHNDRSLLLELSQNAINKIAEEFNIIKQAKAYFELYKNYKQLKMKKTFTIKSVFNRYEDSKLVCIGFKIIKKIKKKLQKI